jgi:DNA-binding transcriptional ArsR family regulator
MSSAALSMVFSALADPTRRAILQRLSRGEAPVKDLAEPFALSGPAITKHLKVLERAGLITRSREGQQRPCRLEPGALEPAAAFLEAYRVMWEEKLDRLGEHLKRVAYKEEAARAAEARSKATSRAGGTTGGSAPGKPVKRAQGVPRGRGEAPRAAEARSEATSRAGGTTGGSATPVKRAQGVPRGRGEAPRAAEARSEATSRAGGTTGGSAPGSPVKRAQGVPRGRGEAPRAAEARSKATSRAGGITGGSAPRTRAQRAASTANKEGRHGEK